MIRPLVVLTLTAAGLVGPSPASAGGSAEPYIVVFDDGVSATQKAAEHHVRPTRAYSSALQGFAVDLTNAQLAAIRRDPQVRMVVPDRSVGMNPVEWQGSLTGKSAGQTIPTGVRRIGGLESPTARIDGRDDRIDVDVAVIDGGIDVEHPDLNVAGFTNCSTEPTYEASGHGTHVSGIIGALDNGFGVVGVSPGARIWSVQVLEHRHGTGTLATVICGVDWVAARADVIEVANMSLAALGPDDGNCGLRNGDPLHVAICGAVKRGVTFVVAAGNAAVDAALLAPASYDEVITVSALSDYDGLPGGLAEPTCSKWFGADDTFATYSDFGPDIDIAAPGTCIYSTFDRSGGYAYDTGTSMASPHVAGAAALYLRTHPHVSPAKVRDALVALAFPGLIAGDPDGIAEPLLNVAGL